MQIIANAIPIIFITSLSSGYSLCIQKHVTKNAITTLALKIGIPIEKNNVDTATIANRNTTKK